jgi:hypothetical protein
VVGAIAPGTMDVGSDLFLSVFPREKSLEFTQFQRGPPPARIHRLGIWDPPAVAATPSVSVAGGSGGVGFLGTSGPGHEAPNASGSGRIRPRSPEISWSLGGFASHGQSVPALWL